MESFAVVPSVGPSFRLDYEGIATAAALVQQTAKKSWFQVTVTGEMKKDMVKVDSIVVAK
jgi:hypothetical protein